ncbi:hypothetical protein GGF46_000374 [Coemansia sp. RSA 552]|nr:hypothetical protein GGF46_000374 [Coemansia sp. RSA 552]
MVHEFLKSKTSLTKDNIVSIELDQAEKDAVIVSGKDKTILYVNTLPYLIPEYKAQILDQGAKYSTYKFCMVDKAAWIYPEDEVLVTNEEVLEFGTVGGSDEGVVELRKLLGISSNPLVVFLMDDVVIKILINKELDEAEQPAVLAQKLVASGARVALVDILPPSHGLEFCAELDGEGHASAYVQIDLSKGTDITKMYNWAIEHFGAIDVLINNAALASPEKLFEGETFDRISMLLDVNLRAPIETQRQFVHYLKSQNRRGVVINMASMGGLVPNPGGEVYGAAKAGIIHLTKASRPLAPQIRVSAIAPYYVDTPMVKNNPKLQGLSYPALTLSVDQVCDSIIRCIKDTRAAGNTYALIGTWGYMRMWLHDLTALHIKILAVWSLAFATICQLFSRRPAAT